MTARVGRFLRDETAAAIEYGLIVAVIALLIMSAIKPNGSKLNARFSVISNALN